jgi:putative SOS response-associated peptidase YedK
MLSAMKIESAKPRDKQYMLTDGNGLHLLVTPGGSKLWRLRYRFGGKQPWYFTPRDGSLTLTVAGLWDEWKNPETGEPLKSCTMIIAEPNKFVAEVHDRMPVLLAEDQFDPWLSGEAGTEYLKPAGEDVLQKWSVSKRVNSSRADDNDPTLIDRV